MRSIALVLAIASFSCKESPHSRPRARTVTHANGLQLQLGDQLAAFTTDGGFRLQHVNHGQHRSPFVIDVRLRSQSPPAGLARRKVDGHDVHYRVDERSGGSGGAEFTLLAFRALRIGYLELEMRRQSEEPPEWSTAWTVIRSARLR